ISSRTPSCYSVQSSDLPIRIAQSLISYSSYLYTVVETGRSSIHRHIHEPKQEEESIEEDMVNYDEADLLPPPIIQLSDRSQKRSSGRVTMPSSRLRGYEVY
ncbi:hypothetical protein N7527_010238, partial [Penicillium freii]